MAEIQPRLELLSGTDLHDRVIVHGVLQAERTVWIATANLKDMHVALGRGYRPILECFDEMARKGVRFRVIHSDLPSRPFRDTLERFERLTSGALELQVCPRSHLKIVVVDGQLVYLGSANFTGAGLGVRKAERRNLELGLVSRDRTLVDEIAAMFDRFWIGECCRDCAFQKRCPDPIGG